MPTPTVLVLGSNGRFGQAVVKAFAAAGWRVLAQARRAPAALSAGVHHVAAALEDTDALAAQAAGVRAVVYAVNPVYTEWTQKLMPLARQGMAVAERLGALFMLPGNVYAFGEGMPARLREDTPERPTTEKGRQRQALEAEMRDRAAQGRMKAVVIRAGDFYGEGSGSWLDLAVAKSLAQGKLVYPGPLDIPHAWAYLPDLARAFVAVAAQSDAPAFRALHFAGHTLTGRELLAQVAAAADALGLRPERGWRQGGMPWGVIRAIGLVHPMMRELARMSYLWRVPHALEGSALEHAVGPLPATPPADALRAALVDLGSAGAWGPPLPLPRPALSPHRPRHWPRPPPPPPLRRHAELGLHTVVPNPFQEIPMTTPSATLNNFAALEAPPSRARALGALLVLDALLSFAPLAILAPAIGWPASLGKPAAEQLGAIAAAPQAVMAGYGVYLLYSILVAPLMIGLASRLRGGLAAPLGMTVAAFATLSALARAIGILRWLTVMPALAATHAAADPAARAQIEALFSALTLYGGGIGEVLGVSLFMALALGTLSIGALVRGGLPTWLAVSGLVAALGLAALALPVFGGPAVMPVAVAVSLLSAWMLAAGVRCLWGGELA